MEPDNNNNNNNNNKENITFLFEDTIIDELEDNELELEKMLQKFQFDDDDDDDDDTINDVTKMNDDTMNDGSIKDMIYFIKRDYYCGNYEYYYNEEYGVKDLMKICQYYGIAKNVKASKCKKQDIVSTIIYFESSPKNNDIVESRHKMWACMIELLEDPKMRGYLLF